ncbi:MAG: hypothetical protein KAT52_00860 [Desulfobacterales bacterium]|nr:hypothetical protein [Desulfobacterales bacterium]
MNCYEKNRVFFVKIHHGTTRSFTENCKQCVSYYKNIKLERRLRADLFVENKVIKNITNQDEAQLIDYFKTTRLRKGLLIIQCNSVRIRGELLPKLQDNNQFSGVFHVFIFSY